MNINMLRDDDDDAGFWAAAAASDPSATWRNATLYRSTDGSSYSAIKTITTEATMGTATTVLGDFHTGNIPDEINSVNVVLIQGTLSSTDYAGLLAGTNMAVIGEEIVYFRTATLESNGSYTLRGFLRGRRGSEYAMGGHATGDRFILVNFSTLSRISQTTSDIGVARYYKPVSGGSTLAATAAQIFTNAGVGLKPYAPVHLGGGSDADGNFTLHWTRRNRMSGEWRNAVDVPNDEATEQYVVEIYDDAAYTTRLRTITGITSATASYSAAAQTTDFGSPQAIVYFKVYQVSAVVGRGHAALGDTSGGFHASEGGGEEGAVEGGGGEVTFPLGVNLHLGGSSLAENTEIVAILEARRVTSVRVDLFYDTLSNTLLADIITKCVAAGITVQGVAQTRAQWDNTIYAGGSLATWESNNYTDMAGIVATYGPLGVTDFEILNEVPLRSECLAQVAFNSGQLESAYTGQTAFISIASALKGMADAVHAASPSYRVILGTVGRDWGFLRYMDTLGVNFDVVGWHIYPRATDTSLLTDTYFGTGGPLAQLDAFGKPITINEFNSGEIYDGGYGNTAGDTETEAGFVGLTNHLQDLYGQTVTDRLESVVLYELLDEPAKSAPESNFGLMYSLSTPKVALYIATAFAGGTLTAMERLAITSRGLLTDAEIDAMQP